MGIKGLVAEGGVMAEILGRLMNSAKWPDGTTGGGMPTYTNDDVAGACAGMTRHVYLYARAKFCLDYTVLPELRWLNRQAARYRAEVKGWRGSNQQVDILADLALSEALEPRKCKTCNGSKVQQNQKACPSCGGKGFLGPKGRDCAEAMDVNPSTWTRSWEHKLDDLMRDFAAFDRAVNAHVRKQLRTAEAS